jgi:hypothetical protein
MVEPMGSESTTGEKTKEFCGASQRAFAVVNKTLLAELVHEQIDAATSRANQFRQSFLGRVRW